MHGLILVSFRDYLTAMHGAAVEDKVMGGESPYLLSEAYPDDHFESLVEVACDVTGLAPSALLHDFGVFTAERTFARLYPAIFALFRSARSFLLSVERHIHEVVRVALPNALRPPSRSPSSVTTGYRSSTPRGAVCAHCSEASSRAPPPATANER